MPTPFRLLSPLHFEAETCIPYNNVESSKRIGRAETEPPLPSTGVLCRTLPSSIWKEKRSEDPLPSWGGPGLSLSSSPGAAAGAGAGRHHPSFTPSAGSTPRDNSHSVSSFREGKAWAKQLYSQKEFAPTTGPAWRLNN